MNELTVTVIIDFGSSFVVKVFRRFVSNMIILSVLIDAFPFITEA